MNGMWCLNETERKEAEGTLRLAKRLGFIEEAGLEALEERRKRKNEEIQDKLKKGETVYGLVSYSAPSYLQYELTRFRLDFVSGQASDYVYREITEKEKEKFYQENQDLFIRYLGDTFPYEDVRDIIEKRIREEEYHELIKDLLCQRAEGK